MTQATLRAADVAEMLTDPPPDPIPAPMDAMDLIRSYPELRDPVIDGLLRRGEVLNLISGPKGRKSWALMHLSLCIAVGRDWFCFPTVQGRVLVLDYELAPGTLAKRLEAVSRAMGIDRAELGGRVSITSLRGKVATIYETMNYLEAHATGYSLIVVDPLYRLFPKDLDENSNANVTALYGLLQKSAEQTGAAIAVVHHSSKGSQSDKAVSDVGAGAGAQSRAADTHLAIRRHAEPDAAVVSCILRSFAPIEDFAIRWVYPLWQMADELNPADLWRAPRRTTTIKAKSDHPNPRAEVKPVRDVDWLAAEVLTPEPQFQARIIALAVQAGVKNNYQAKTLLEHAEGLKKAFRWPMPGDKRTYFANVPPPVLNGLEDTHTQKKRFPPRTPHAAEKPLGGREKVQTKT